MAFYVSTNLKSWGCAAGEPIVASYQPRSATGVVEDISKREFFISFFTLDRADLGRHNAEFKTDDTGNFVSWVLPGSVSNDLFEAGHRVFIASLNEDLKDGTIDEIAQATFTITLAAPYKVTSANTNAAFARYTVRITRANDAFDAFSAPRFNVTVLPYGANATPTPLPAPAFTAAPAISGSAVIGQTLTASDGTILNGSVTARQWLRDGSPISGATGSSYTLVNADGSAAITFRVTATGSGGSTSSTSSVVMIPAAPIVIPAPAFTVAPSISGSGTVGQTLTASDGTISDGSVSARQWLRNDVAINGATASTYKLVNADAGASISLRVTAAGPSGTTVATSSPVTVAALVLGTLTISSNAAQVGVNKLITIGGAVDGSTLTGVVPDGMILSSANRTIAGTPRTAGTYSFDLTETLAGATGSPRKTTVIITVDAEAGSDEAVISPAVTSERSMYSLKDEGIIFRKQSGMTGSGPFWTTALEVAQDAFWGPLGIKYIAYSSDDHASGDSGIYLYLTRNPDPKVAADWVTYNQALAAGVFASVATKPTKNPIFVHEAGASTETPFIMKVGNDWVMHYQTYKLPNSVNQCTNRVLSTDGLNWTGTRTAPLLQPQGRTPGDGHTGYFRCGPNRFDRTKIPFDWVGYSLCGGTSRGLFAQWGSNDPVGGEWTMIQLISAQYGALGQQNAGPTGGDINNARVTRQGVALIANRSGGGAGVTNQYGTISEVLLDNTGTTVIAKPIDLVSMPLNADISSQISVASVLTVGQERIVIAQGSRAPDANTHVNSIAMFSSPRRNPQNTWFEPLPLTIPANLTTREVDFRTVTAMPSSITVFNNSPASGVIGFDPTVGLNLNHPSGGTIRNFVGYFEEIPADANFVDLYVTSWCSRGNGAYRDMGFGFWMPDTAGAAIVGLNDGNRLFVGNGGATPLGRKGSTVAGATVAEGLSQYPSLSYQAQSNTYPYAVKCVGIRWYRSAGRCFMLGEGKLAYGVETEEIAVPTELKPGGSLYGKVIRPRFGLVTHANQVNQEQIMGVRARWG